MVNESPFHQLGVCRAESIKKFFDVARSFVIGTLPANGRVAMVTVSGGVGVLMADAVNRRSSADATNADTIESLDNNPFLVRPDGAIALDGVLVARPRPHDRAQTPTVPVRSGPSTAGTRLRFTIGHQQSRKGQAEFTPRPSTTGPDNRAQAVEPRRSRNAYGTIRLCAPPAQRGSPKSEWQQ